MKLSFKFNGRNWKIVEGKDEERNDEIPVRIEVEVAAEFTSYSPFYPVGNSLCKVHFLRAVPFRKCRSPSFYFAPPSFLQALFTRPAPLTSSSPSYHSSVGDETGFRELEKGRMT